MPGGAQSGESGATMAGYIADTRANVKDVELGYKFETLVAAALVRYDGTVAELIHAADIDFRSKTRRRKLPEWTADARFDCQYHVCANASEVVNKLLDRKSVE